MFDVWRKRFLFSSLLRELNVLHVWSKRSVDVSRFETKKNFFGDKCNEARLFCFDDHLDILQTAVAAKFELAIECKGLQSFS
jgi:hypothetical protein